MSTPPLYSETAGAGSPVVMLHGGFCSLESLRVPFDALAAEHFVLAFERPGHGRSADGDGPYSYERGVEETLDQLDAHGLGAVDVVGYSDGAIIGLMLAMRHPERVRSLVSISANLDPSAFSAEAPGAVVLAPPHERATASASLEPGVEPDPEPDLERMHYDRLSPDGPQHAEVVLAKLMQLWTTEPHIDPAELAGIRARVLVMAGDRDSIRPDHTLRIAAAIPGAELAIVPGTGHGLIAERPALVTELIREFLSRP